MQEILLLILSVIALAGGFAGSWWVASMQRPNNAIGIFFGTLGMLIVGGAGLFGAVYLSAMHFQTVSQ